MWQIPQRAINTAAGCPLHTRFTLQTPKEVKEEYGNGSLYNFSAEFLRIISPAVDSKMRSDQLEIIRPGLLEPSREQQVHPDIYQNHKEAQTEPRSP